MGNLDIINIGISIGNQIYILSNIIIIEKIQFNLIFQMK